MKKIFTRLFVLFLLSFVTTSAWAQSTITAGKVYNIVNVGNSGQSMAAVGVEKSAIAATDVSDYSQLWYVGSGTADGSYTLRNLGNGRYLQGAGTSACWEFATEPANLYYVAAGSYYTFSSSNDSGGYNNMHYSASQGMVVGWTTGASATQWTFNEVEIDAAALETNWAELDALNNASANESIYQPYLENIFSDKSCSQLNSTYSSMSDSQLQDDENYSKLPEALQKMVKKVRDSDWAEANCIDTKPSWSSEHAKRFRLQLYEPYSYGRSTSNMLGIYYHSDMNNPTGLVANCRDLLYVMVEGEIKEGAKLYLQPLVGTGIIGGVDGVELHEGLNIVPCWADGSQYFIQYVIDTYNAETREITEYKLSNYSPIKIHIEGGDINGCFDTVGDDLNLADTDADWDAFEARAHQYNFTVIGKYMMWHMPLSLDGDYKDLAECLGTNETSVKAAMDVWEAIESAQRLASGFMSAKDIETIPYAAKVFEYNGNDDYYPSDYSEQYNNRSLAYTTADGYFMFASPGGYSHYASSTLYDVVKNIPTGGDTWGPAHEIGHTHQGPINLPSTSETSNNALANISNYFISRTSSRLGTMSDVLSQFNNETSFLGVDMNSNNVWDKLMMYTKLWFYYHVAGNNKKFYPRLFEMLRQDPISRVQGTPLTGEQTMLKFYKKACMAAEEDLTDFFDAFGFFVPVDGTLSDDYGDFKTVMTQEEIDAAKQEIAQMAKEKGWVKNITILFIDDRVGTVIGADGTTVLARRGDGSNETGVLGSINDYDSDPANDIYPTATGTYGYSVSGNSITMTGATGGVGFAIYDADGNLISFSNAYSFTLSEEAQAAIASGTATVVAVNADNTTTEVADNNPSQTQAALLAELIPLVEDMLSYEDATETKVGWYKSNALTSLKTAYNNAKDVYDKGELASYSGVYSVLYDEYNKVISSPTSKVWFVEGRTYYIKNVGGGTYMTLNESNVIANETVPTASTPAALWQVSEGFYDTFYRIKNQSTGTYIQNPTAETNSVQYTVASNAHDFIFEEVSTGKFTIKDRGKKKYLNYHSDGTVSTWGAAGENSQWEFVYLAADNTMALRSQLEDLTLLAQELVDETAEANVEYTEIPLQVTDPSAQYYIWCNNPDTYEGDIKYLVDGNTDGSTGFFHSNWHNTASDAGYHYLEVDLGASNANTVFKFAYSTRNAGSNHPDDFTVKASNTKDNYSNTEFLYTVTSGLPDAISSEWESPVFCSGGTPYRYLHFKIGGNNTFWHLDEFDLFVPKVSVKMLEKYSGIDDEYAIALQICLIESSAIINDATATENELSTAISNLQNAYDALLSEKETVESAAIEAEKAKLEELIATAKELYNSCAESITEVPATETAITLQTTNENADYYLFCNAPYLADSESNDYCPASQGYNLLDGNPETYLHTAWNGSGSVSSDGQAHYLLIDLGEDNLSTYFKFSYLTRNNDGASEKPKIINVEGSNDKNTYEPIISLSGLPNASNYTYASSVLGNGVAYRYLRLVVADTHRALWDSNGFKSFSMAEFDLWTATIQDFVATLNAETCGSATEKEVLNVYRAVLSAEKTISIATTPEQLNAAYELLSKEYGILYTAMNNTAALKENLKKLIDDTQALYDKMATDEGAVNEYYSTSSLTADNLSEALAMITAAQTVYDNSSATVGEINTAFNELNVKYGVLYGIEELNVAADARTDITGLIEKMEELLGEVADKTTAKTAIALQTTDANAEFYIWSNATAWDCNGIGALIDKNDDGTAKTGTFFGTTWDSGTTVNNYDHYITVDLGTEIALNELSIDYTTRNSTHSNQRPTAIKVLGSNDKEGEYVEITHLSEGMPVGQCVKWEMTSTVALDNYYRYIRFAPATEVGYFNMSDFNLYAHSAVKANDNYSTSDITTAQLFAMNAALLDGIAARDNYVTEENYNTALATLQTQYNALLMIKNANVLERTSLEGLITQTSTLIEEVAAVDETETVLTMQCTDVNAPYYLYCNAPGKTNTTWNTTDSTGVKSLLDDNADTYLHTTYEGNDYADDLDHYLRLDMGENEALAAFKFNYVGRVGNTGNAPKTIVVEGSNDRENFEEITTLKNLPTADNTTYQSDVITNGKAYRYIRFMVKETSNGSKYKEHQYFALSQFAVTACKTIEVKTEYVSPNLPLSTLVTANNEVVDATVIKNQFYVTETVYNTTEEELQAAYDALNLAKNLKELPVILTTDANNPVLYKIRINRSALKVLAIDDSDAKVPVEDFVRDDDTQSWYFMQGTNTESYDDIQIFPYWYNGAANTTLRLGAASADNAAGTVTAVEGTDATNTIQNWYITRASGTEEGWWNIQPEGKANYFSNNGGIANKMGFWNSASDNGSEFQFLLDCPYTDLSIIFGASVARQAEDNAPGYYANAANYNAVYDIASGYVTNANGTDEEYTAALDNLIAAKTALSDGGRVPSDALEDGAVYRIMNLITNTAAGYEYHYIQNSSATIAFPTTPAVDDNSCLWVCKANSDGTYEFVSALGTLSLGWKEGSENAQAFTIADGVVTGAKCMKNSSNQRMALTNEKYGSLAFNHASNDEVQSSNWSTDWYFDKIDDADVKFNVNISSRRFSSLYLPYDVEVPDGVGAFTAVAVDGTAVELVRVADKLDSSRHGTVVPARTPVILYIEDIDVTQAGSFEFAYTTDEANLPDDVKANVDAAIIHGHILKTPILCENSYRYYKLGGKSGDTVSKMYWMWKEYGSDGVIADGNAGTDNGGYISCSANKIYMKVAETLAANSFSMRFGADSGTTGIDGLSDQSAKDREIYDLQGRKLSEITEPGIYIVNGKKVYVK